MADEIVLGDLHVDVIRKTIKNLHLAVLPPHGKVRIAAPRYMKLDTIRVFVISKLAWIKAQQHKMQMQEREAPREYLDRESHYVWGKRYLMRRVEKDAAPAVALQPKQLVLQVRPRTDEARCQDILDGWYREQIRAVVPALVAKWEPVMGVKVGRVFVQRMKTQWGSCNPISGAIRLNTDLAKKPPECLEYIVVHEMVHLLEPTHNARFSSLMSLFLPQWQQLREMLNRLPVRHEDWRY
ncbi:M48 family metallopeptidase [Ralstonia pseudosolanacearum]|uniref:M48 family metallopeptidase n=1 Tax=Ralstonia pseudosolanacearum TaxID=1310165 RepID=UPI0007D86712|nr:SprT family zinc-dependent metalloprotease [Ralstonia pseudosolanacearum]QIK19343.1 M48 family metallopeptidase [Ralstonia solanacearum]MCD9228203.1 M48 family metallopeptidase [Ralstonia pseudosolanacearum]MDC6292794.1 SprT family zinc-dependent metalloprotease [Ralstonia pseudosolanacearum]MDD7787948.1 SprT family zinc-dependent metalloprotease [Ralstonia pseudosolanacearum]MDN3369772.1 SprT family zinc-dependent metalloprotease [Ralstonia pseudosolanacearum]